VVAISDGILFEFYLHVGAESEQTGQHGLPLDLPAGSMLYTDADYTDYVAEDVFNDASSSKRSHHPAQVFLLQYFRKGIETRFSQLTARFLKQVHAVTAAGFAIKIITRNLG
jgi:hypothetical protein